MPARPKSVSFEITLAAHDDNTAIVVPAEAVASADVPAGGRGQFRDR